MRPAPETDATLPALLSLNAGYVDTASFLALQGLFAAHVTGNFLRTPTNRFGIGLAIHWEANQSLARARIAQANAAAKFALAQFDAVVLTALRDAESALSTYSRNCERDGDLTTVQARASEAEEQAKRLYVGGKIDFLALLDAQRTQASADDALAASHARLATDQVAIFLALGGGWE
jgi:outer membrane protein TolC